MNALVRSRPCMSTLPSSDDRRGRSPLISSLSPGRWCILSLLALGGGGLACSGPDQDVRPDPRPTPAAPIKATLEAPFIGITPVSAAIPGALVPGRFSTGEKEDLVLISEAGQYIFERNRDQPKQGQARDERILPGALVDALGSRGGQDGLIAMMTGIALPGRKFTPISFEDVRAEIQPKGGALDRLGGLARRQCAPRSLRSVPSATA